MSVKVSGDVIRKLRLERGWTQEQLAAAAAVTPKTIQRVEKSGQCSLETRAALASVLQVEAKQLDGQQKIEQAKSPDGDEVVFVRRLTTGASIVEVFDGSLWYRFSHEDARSPEDADAIAFAVQTINDWSEIWSDLEPGARIKATFELGELLRDLESAGFRLFGIPSKGTFKIPEGRSGHTRQVVATIANFHVAYADSDKMIVVEPVITV